MREERTTQTHLALCFGEYMGYAFQCQQSTSPSYSLHLPGPIPIVSHFGGLGTDSCEAGLGWRQDPRDLLGVDTFSGGTPTNSIQ
jgi:hypothetical protein